VKAIIVMLLLAPWVAAIAWVVRRGGWRVLSGSGDVRSQADRMRAFGAR
jgi:hypothetical protein